MTLSFAERRLRCSLLRIPAEHQSIIPPPELPISRLIKLSLPTASDALAWLGLKAMALAWLLLAYGLALPKPRPWCLALAWPGLALA